MGNGGVNRHFPTLFFFNKVKLILSIRINIHFFVLKCSLSLLKPLLTRLYNLLLCLKTSVLQLASIMTLTWILGKWLLQKCCLKPAGIQEPLKRQCCYGWKKRILKNFFSLFFFFYINYLNKTHLFICIEWCYNGK